MSRVLAIGDIHAPATRKGYMQFCIDMYEAWDCDKVVFIGDVIDWHAISFWAKNPACPGPSDEYKLAKKCVEKWYAAFPKAKVCIGNHDERPGRLAKSVGIPEYFIKGYKTMWETPGWTWDHKFVIDKVLYRHGKGCSGIHPAWNLVNKVHQSVVIGHCHTRAGVKATCNENMRLFGLDTGCGIDERMMQFAYGHDNPVRAFLACGVVIDGVGYHEPMLCGKGEPYWDGDF